ncbi:MAG: MBL fold metallo-hydrolase [Syntrophales bacterium]|jgi:glyoxylase-like metal-dependent hydrolase (beta-lactamase superfamily II)|nr:MBL fold metallo-hydrolase [Syntrophales bacterium]MDY0044238.1 MBL fold metallo-hydrolase [Syntrophales bacterium]
MVHLIDAGYANTYLIEDSGGEIAVDVGTSLAAEKVVQYLTEKYGCVEGVLCCVTATHFHIDHVGGIERLKKLCPAIPVRFHISVKDYASGCKSLSVPSFSRWMFGLVPTLIKLKKPFRNAYQALSSSKTAIPLPLLRNWNKVNYAAVCNFSHSMKLGPLSKWIVLETPGHTPDSISFFCEEKKTLISGDTILNMDGKGELNRFCFDSNEIRNSFERLCLLDVENIYPGHGDPVTGIKGALSQVRC